MEIKKTDADVEVTESSLITFAYSIVQKLLIALTSLKSERLKIQEFDETK